MILLISVFREYTCLVVRLPGSFTLSRRKHIPLALVFQLYTFVHTFLHDHIFEWRKCQPECSKGSNKTPRVAPTVSQSVTMYRVKLIFPRSAFSFDGVSDLILVFYLADIRQK